MARLDPGSNAPAPPTGPRRQLSLLDSTSVIVGIIIGATIYQSSPLIASSVHTPRALLALWAFGGFVALLGAICYAELSTAYPREGGDYIFLSRAYGRQVGFLFAWAEFWIIRPGNIGAMAFVFARYAAQITPLGHGERDTAIYACASVILLTALNVLGVRTGKSTQNLLTAAKLGGLLALFAAGLLLANPAGPATPTTGPAERSLPSMADLTLGMIFVFFAYGGWSEIVYVAAEVREPQRNIWRAMFLGIAAVTLLYLVGNVAFVRALSFHGLATSSAPAADVLARTPLRRIGSIAISSLICVSALGALNGMILTGARISYAAGRDNLILALLGSWNPKLDSPVRSLALQAASVILLMTALGSAGKGFERLVVFTSPAYYLFLVLSILSLFVLRYRDPNRPRPFLVTLYPLIPILFLAFAGFMLYSSTTYAFSQLTRAAWWSAAVMAAGLALAFLPRTPYRDEPIPL